MLKKTPVFEQDFDGFLDYLYDAETKKSSISPKRFGEVLHMDLQTIAGHAQVHRNTISKSPESESVQRFLRESLRIICAAADISESIEKALYWFKNSPLQPFGYKTPQEIVSEGKTDNLLRYIGSLKAGFAG